MPPPPRFSSCLFVCFALVSFRSFFLSSSSLLSSFFPLSFFFFYQPSRECPEEGEMMHKLLSRIRARLAAHEPDLICNTGRQLAFALLEEIVENNFDVRDILKVRANVLCTSAGFYRIHPFLFLSYSLSFLPLGSFLNLPDVATPHRTAHHIQTNGPSGHAPA